MKTYLPHYFKRIGVILFLTAIVLSITGNLDDVRKGFTEGWNEASSSSNQTKTNIQSIKQSLNLSTSKINRIIETPKPIFKDEKNQLWVLISLILSISGLILYLFSKEEVEDEYIQQIRLKSISQSLLITWLIYGLIKFLFKEYQFEGLYILQFQLIIYVIIFRHNKNSELSVE